MGDCRPRLRSSVSHRTIKSGKCRSFPYQGCDVPPSGRANLSLGPTRRTPRREALWLTSHSVL